MLLLIINIDIHTVAKNIVIHRCTGVSLQPYSNTINLFGISPPSWTHFAGEFRADHNTGTTHALLLSNSV